MVWACALGELAGWWVSSQKRRDGEIELGSGVRGEVWGRLGIFTLSPSEPLSMASLHLSVSSPRSSGTVFKFFSKYITSHSKDHWRWILDGWGHSPFDFPPELLLLFPVGQLLLQDHIGPRRRLDGKTWQQFLPPSSETSVGCWSSVIHAKGCFLQFLSSSPAFPLPSSPTGRGKAAMLIERLIS